MADSQLLFFIATSLLVILIPGQDLVLVMSRGMASGVKAGILTAAGVSVGLLGHTLLAGLGLGALLTSSAWLYFALKIVGALYLAYLGVKLWLAPAVPIGEEGASTAAARSHFIVGALSNLANPKITVFYFAFLPQFVSSDTENPTMLLLALGVLFACLTFIVKAPVGLFAGAASGWLRTRPRVIQLLNRVSGTVLLGLGAKLALDLDSVEADS